MNDPEGLDEASLASRGDQVAAVPAGRRASKTSTTKAQWEAEQWRQLPRGQKRAAGARRRLVHRGVVKPRAFPLPDARTVFAAWFQHAEPDPAKPGQFRMVTDPWPEGFTRDDLDRRIAAIGAM